jgi:ABC-type sugar transport system ATPase subunit
MRQGRIEQVGTPEEVYARPASTYVARFIGSPPMDILRGELMVANGSTNYRVGTATFPLSDTSAHALASLAAPGNGAIDLGIRAEHVLLRPVDEGVPATVQVSQPLGPATVITAAWDGGTLTTRVPGIATLPPGERVGLQLYPAGMLFFDRQTGQRLGT